MNMQRSLILSLLLAAAPAVTYAQAPPTAATPPQATAPAETSNECGSTRVSGAPAPDSVTTGQSNEALGDRLAKTNGVLCPPSGIDPQMHAPTPEGGNTPVIPPPGSPGGNPNVQPK